MVNLSDFKLENIRKTFEVNINDETQEIVIFNALGKDRQNIKDRLSELSQDGLEGTELVEKIYTDIFINHTNIVVDEDIIDVLNAPTGNMLKVMQEVYDIIYEIQTEMAMEKYRMLCDLESTEYAKLMLLKTQETLLITEECKKVEKNIKNLKKEFSEKSE